MRVFDSQSMPMSFLLRSMMRSNKSSADRFLSLYPQLALQKPSCNSIITLPELEYDFVVLNPLQMAIARQDVANVRLTLHHARALPNHWQQALALWQEANLFSAHQSVPLKQHAITIANQAQGAAHPYDIAERQASVLLGSLFAERPCRIEHQASPQQMMYDALLIRDTPSIAYLTPCGSQPTVAFNKKAANTAIKLWLHSIFPSLSLFLPQADAFVFSALYNNRRLAATSQLAPLWSEYCLTNSRQLRTIYRNLEQRAKAAERKSSQRPLAI